ncbi:unnamed protein product [Adineta steineri]|uniref:non-specific serine/threonine protein kinase n=1 Tax=Adineta steineri TaxID=433720 RepID=A0A814XH93_9BILA|nr:unnamed protein product [Adineta steineri]
MAEKASKRSKGPARKKEMKEVHEPVDEETEEPVEFRAEMEEQEQQFHSKKGPPMKSKNSKFYSEPIDMQRKAPQSLPANFRDRHNTKNDDLVQQEINAWTNELAKTTDKPSGSHSPLQPITSTRYLNTILQNEDQTGSIKAFKDAFIEDTHACGKIICDASALLTDVHLYELSQLQWPHLKKILIRACPHVTSYALNYIQIISDQQKHRDIKVNVELMLHAHNTIEDKNDVTQHTITSLEKLFGKSTKTSISKVLIYHANSENNFTLSSKQMIINQIQKSKEKSSMLIDSLLSTHDGCQIALLECINFILFKELCSSFHPQIIYMVVSSVDEVIKTFFSLDCNTSFTILQKLQIRLIILSEESIEQFLTNLHSQLNHISKTAHDLYKQYSNDNATNLFENDDFRRNHYMSSLLHIQTKYSLLMEHLNEDHCILFKQKDPSFISNYIMKDAVKYCNSLYTLDTQDNYPNKVVRTNEPITKLIDKIINQSKTDYNDSMIPSATKLANIYFTHRLITDNVLDIYSTSNNKSYLVSDIEWFCHTVNHLFNMETHSNRKTEHILEQFKHTIGTNIHIITKHELKKLEISGDEMDFFQWLFGSWGIAYPISTEEQGDTNIFILFNSISSDPPVPLSTVWSPTWPADEYEFSIYFHLLHPCDEAILFRLYKLFPSQKLILASKYFLLIQEGAIEILIQYHHENKHQTSISITSRTLNLNGSTDKNDKTSELINESFEYITREYFVIIWAYLFKCDYAYKIEVKNKEISNPFDAIVGNELMHDKWKHLALYHYSSAPTLTSPCSVCGLRPSANRSLYNASTLLSPSRQTSTIATTSELDQSGFFIINLDNSSFAYTSKHNLRPDGCNSFEVIFLNENKNNEQNSPILSSIEIGCLINNPTTKQDEKILFEYGGDRKKPPKASVNQKSQKDQQMSYLDQIRQFGGLQGLKSTKGDTKNSGLQEFYNGLRLRVDILFTHKPNTYEFVFSINDIPWSQKTIKRKSAQVMFQPYIITPGTKEYVSNLRLILYHHISALDTAIISPSITNSPWKVGMRLEAKDRKNPSILAIANVVEVYEDNRIRINFDGWTSTFDYTVEVDNSDLHPCGYWEYIQRVLYKNVDTTKPNPHLTFTRYDKPKSYDGRFSWRNYLTELNVEPVPFECFNYMQTEGMPVDYFPHSIATTEFTSLSCRHYYNVRVKYHKMNTFVQNEIANRMLYEHHMKLSAPTSTTSPGVVLLPTPFTSSTLTYPCLKQFQNSSNATIHLTCNHRCLSPLDSTSIVSGAHLLDTKGDHTDKTAIAMSIITICMLTAVDLARNQKHLIAPSTSELISDKNNSFNKNLTDFYIRRWLDLSAYITCLHSTSFYTKRPSVKNYESDSNILYNCYSDQDLFSSLKSSLDSIDIKFTLFPNTYYQKQFGKYGECYYCCLFRDDEIKDRTSDLSFQKRLDIIGDYAPSIFYFELYKPEKNAIENRLILNDEFFLKFTGLEIIDITNVVIDRFQLSKKNIESLKNLTYISLENNDLTMINMDFRHLKKLISIKLKQNPFQTLPTNIFSSSSLQYIELSELGRLAELDPNTRFSSELKTLSMTNSIFTTLPLTLGTDARSKLTELTINGVAWWGVEGMSVNEVVKYESFEQKFTSYLDNEELRSIYYMYDEDANGILSYSEINLMNAHIYRFVPRLRPSSQTKIPNSGRSSVDPSNINELDTPKQDSFITDQSGFPSAIFYLENLNVLTLDYQGIKNVPDAIKSLRYLSILNLNYCVELETISPEVGLLPLKELNLTGCVSLKTPPIEITRRGHTQIMAFLQRLMSGSTACKRTKLMLVGLGGAGKTSLVRAFLESHSTAPPVVTDGIDILKWKVPLDNSDDVLEYSVWDFAGQSVYYHTHQFFLAKKAVYVLAWNIRLGAEHAGLDFWLSSICCHAPNAPIFVVGTHMDQVSRIDLRQDDLKRRYPQIAGFFNVSTATGDCVPELINTIIKTTLALPYMDEQIPKVWLKFEDMINARTEDILAYKEVENIAHEAGIFEPDEVLQAVLFLHDLGSLQYFSSEHLKNYVVINPQWIVNVMACIVSIKDSPVKNGRLYYSDIGTIWKDYSEDLHPWILKLTEAFDLTFPVPDQNMNLVPCLLPEEEPEYTWIDDTTNTENREMKVVYIFNYLPAGLFNRAQVRLFQFSDKSTIWRYGSLLSKNNHRAVIMRTDDQHIIIKIQGIRPDNILFLIHEVFEGLVNESFFGVTYDITFPCPDCVELGTNEPWQFSSSLINRAIELKSPSIQCHRFFHVASVTDLQALVPPDSKSNYDLHLEYSVRDLKSYKQNVSVDIVYIYPSEHIPTMSEIESKVDPRKINEDLTKRGLKIWTPDSLKDFKIENHYLVIKEAKCVIFGISTELITNRENKNLCDALQTIMSILRKPIIPVLFGTDMGWKETDVGVGLLDKLYINMQNPKRYENRIIELMERINEERGDDKKKQQLRDQPTDVFISYCWANSHDAASKGSKSTPTSIGWGDPRSLKDYVEGRGLSVWMDISRLGKSGVLHDIVHGLKNTHLVIACVSDEYTQSEVCRNEFLFAKNTLRLPVILAVFGSGDKWRQTEVGMCSLTCPQVNFQFENPNAFEELFVHVQTNLPKKTSSTKQTTTNANTTSTMEEKTTAAYQELFELTQRKFLRLTSSFAETMTARPYPRLFTLDFMGEKEKSTQELIRIEMSNQANTRVQKDSDVNNERDIEAERQRDEELIRTQKNTETVIEPKVPVKKLCIRTLCENEENWHAAGSPYEITDNVLLQNGASYLSRIMLLLKQSDLPLEILTNDDGEIELQKLAELSNTMGMEVKDSYGHIRRCIMDCDSEEKYSGLKQCLMPSGKVLWLCEEHQKQPRVVLVTASVTGGYTGPQATEQNEMVKALSKLNERIANNELPQLSMKVPRVRSARRSSSENQSSSQRVSQRFNRQESGVTKSQQQNILETNENDNESIYITPNEADNQTKNSVLENEPTIVSTDCSIM